jgi:hypothetical protein
MEPLDDEIPTMLVTFLLYLEIAVGLFSAVILLAIGCLYYVMFLAFAIPKALYDGEGRLFFAWFTVVIAGGFLGISAILTASRPENICDRSKLIRAALFGLAGLCAEFSLFFGFVLVGGLPLAFDKFTLFFFWALVGPVFVGLHFGYRVIARLAKHHSLSDVQTVNQPAAFH